MTSWSEDRDALRLLITLCEAVRLTTPAGRIAAHPKIRILLATVVLIDAPARCMRCQTSAVSDYQSDLAVKREAAGKAQLDLLSRCVA
jgi:hypothetical protein